MALVRLAHWREKEGRDRASLLASFGFSVQFDAVDAGTLLSVLKTAPPDAVVVDLSRSPAQGRDLGVALRIHGATRGVPLVFVGGTREKVEGIRRVLPDATYTEWEAIESALRSSLENPTVDPVVPESILAGYSGTPLPKKLGIKAGATVLLVHAPPTFSRTLEPLPEGVRLKKRFGSGVGLILWFVRSSKDLTNGIRQWAERVGDEGMWIIWPKKAGVLPSDLTQAVVRKTGLAAGLVDYKVASVDETWSGLKFAVRRRQNSGAKKL